MAGTLDCSNNLSASKPKRHGNWQERETLALIDTWKDFILQMRWTRRNKLNFEKMSDALKFYGIDRSWHEIHLKIKNMACRYRKQLALVEAGKPAEWRYYSRVDRILGEYLKPENRPLQHTENKDLEGNQANDETDNLTSFPSPTSSVHEEDDSHLEYLEGEFEKAAQSSGELIQKEGYVIFKKEQSNDGTAKRSMEDIIEDTLNEFRAMRQESKEIDIEMLDVFKRQNELLEKILDRMCE